MCFYLLAMVEHLSIYYILYLHVVTYVYKNIIYIDLLICVNRAA